MVLIMLVHLAEVHSVMDVLRSVIGEKPVFTWRASDWRVLLTHFNRKSSSFLDKVLYALMLY
jgi:hypothetical protein